MQNTEKWYACMQSLDRKEQADCFSTWQFCIIIHENLSCCAYGLASQESMQLLSWSYHIFFYRLPCHNILHHMIITSSLSRMFHVERWRGAASGSRPQAGSEISCSWMDLPPCSALFHFESKTRRNWSYWGATDLYSVDGKIRFARYSQTAFVSKGFRDSEFGSEANGAQIMRYLLPSSKTMAARRVELCSSNAVQQDFSALIIGIQLL